VEHQKARIIKAIINASEKVSARKESIEILRRALAETQFSKAMEMTKDAVPQALLIDGHNPMTLLHSALSKGLHEQTDEECLETAQAVRVVLAELSERLSLVLKDEHELKSAVARLLKSEQ
jgi:hypothetical protein